MTIRPAAAVGVEPRGHFRQPFRGDGELLPRRAPARIADDAVARGKPGHAFAQALDGAGEFRARRKRKRRLVLVLAGDDQQVEEIQRRGFDPHHGLARPGHRVRQVGDRQVLRLAGPVQSNAFMAENFQVLSGFSGIWPVQGAHPFSDRRSGATLRTFRSRFCPLSGYTYTGTVRRSRSCERPMKVNKPHSLVLLPLLAAAVSLAVRGYGAAEACGHESRRRRRRCSASTATGAPTRRARAAGRSASRCPSPRRSRTIRRTGAPRPTRSTCSCRPGRTRR